jgi:polysaccharide biosynthesis protein PelF
MKRRLTEMKKVLMINWDSYPNISSGGIYSWEKALIDNMPDYEFIIFNLLSNSNANGKFTVPDQVKHVITIPLFGSNRYQEFYDEKKSLLAKILRTRENLIENQFILLFRDFLVNAFSSSGEPIKLANSIFNIHKLMTKYDIKKCLEHPKTWDTFVQILLEDPLYKNITIRDAATIFQAIQRNMQLITVNIPRCDLVHCSLAWFPSFIAICAKMRYGCSIIVTEHGVAFRELLLNNSIIFYADAISIFWKVFSANIIKVIYSMADRIAPVCYFNKEWEEKLNADKLKIKIIYNGIDVSKFKPMSIKKEQHRATVVYVGRITLVKGVVKLIQSIKYVKEAIPDILCLIYGTSTEIDLSNKCIQMVKELGLENNIQFMGGTKEPEKAYNLADIVVNFSAMEGFPFSVIEAMACGKVVVATDVGGVKEALEDCGLLLKSSSHPSEFANAIVKVLTDHKLRCKLEASALRRVKELFTIEKMLEQYRTEYWDLIYENHIANSDKEQLIQLQNASSTKQNANYKIPIVLKKNNTQEHQSKGVN